MKKSIFILVTLFAATFVNAQIVLEHSYNYNLCTPHEIIDENGATMGDIFAYYDENGTLVCIDALTYDELARITIPGMKRYDMIAKNLYSSDGLIGFIARSEDSKGWGHAYVYNQNGIQLADLGECTYVQVIKVSSGYKLVVHKTETIHPEDGPVYYYNYYTDIYSLPGNGDAGQGVESPSAPRKSARKIFQYDQVRIENADRTYTLTGQEIK